MKKIVSIAAMSLMVLPVFASKRTEQGSIQDLQPTNFAVAKKKHQQFDFSIITAGRSYGCRTPANKKISAVDFVVGSPITFLSDGKSGEVKTNQGKSAKCLITRVADTAAQ